MQQKPTWRTMVECLRHPDIQPSHPGELLADAIAASRETKTHIAELLGFSRQTLHDVVAGRQAVTPEMAVRLGKLCGNGPGLWLRMQQAHDLWHAQRTVDVSAIPTLRAA